MRRSGLSPLGLLAALSLACPADVATTDAPADTDDDPATGGASNSETGAPPSSTPGAPTTDDPDDPTVTTGAHLDSGDSEPAGSSTGTTDAGTTDDGTSTGDASSSGDLPVCGDGEPEPGEACDDGNAADDDGCLSTCELGPGGLLADIPLEPLPGMHDDRICFTAIDAAHLEGDGHALAFGANLVDHAFEGVLAARVDQRRLAGLGAAEWTSEASAGIYGRAVHRMATAANGDIVVAGQIVTEGVKPDTGGYLWLARFTPTGATVWSHEFADIDIRAVDLELAADGDIVLAGSFTGFGFYTAAVRFTGAGAPVWEEPGPQPAEGWVWYSGLALDDDGDVYLAGQHQHLDDTTDLVLQARAADGALLWERFVAPPDALTMRPAGLVHTADDALVVAINRQHPAEPFSHDDEFMLAAFDTAGADLWWKSWGPGGPNPVTGGTLLATADGGFHALGTRRALVDDQPSAALAARFTGAGEPVWSVLTPDAMTRDALHGPDGLLYVLTADSVHVHQP